MAKRCCFYIKDNKIERCIVDITWDLGFDFNAKLEYIKRLYEQCSLNGINNVLDVTSANMTDQKGCALSPLLLKDVNGNKVEDVYQSSKDKLTSVNARMAYFDWFYGVAVLNNRISLNILNKYTAFTDVFHRPNEFHCTQAKSCAILRLVLILGKESLYADAPSFYKWRMENVNFIT